MIDSKFGYRKTLDVYFKELLEQKGDLSIGTAASAFAIGKSGVERILSGKCNIPTDTMVRKVALAAGISSSDLYEELEYLPILSKSDTLNTKIQTIIHKRDRFLESGKEKELYIQTYFSKNRIHAFYVASFPHDGKIEDKSDVEADYFSRNPAFIFSGQKGRIIAVDIMYHRTIGNSFMPSLDCFSYYLFRMLTYKNIDEYILFVQFTPELSLLKEFAKDRLQNTPVKVSLAAIDERNDTVIFEKLN